MMLSSTCSELHHGYSRFSYCGAIDDMGLLWYIPIPLRYPNDRADAVQIIPTIMETTSVQKP